MPRSKHAILTACLVGLLGGQAAAERFSLDLPGEPQRSSSAVLEGQTLEITSAEGQRFSYTRRPDLDRGTTAGRMLGFYSRGADQYVLWPEAGRGKVSIGSPDRGRISWRESRMTVRPLGPAPAVVPGGPQVPGVMPGGVPGVAPGIVVGDARPVRNVARAEVAAVRRPGGTFVVGYVDTAGRLLLYEGAGNDWRPLPVRLAQPLRPGGPLAMVHDLRGPYPLVYAVDSRGELVEISGGRSVRPVLRQPAPSFPEGAALSVVSAGGSTLAYAVDESGRLWQVDLADGRHPAVETQPGRYLSGGPLAAVDADGLHVLLVDRQGTLVHYARTAAGPWQVEAVQGGFIPGSYVAAGELRPAVGPAALHVAAVAADGRTRLFRWTGDRWIGETLRRAGLPPGEPITLAETPGGIALSGVDADGTWVELTEGDGPWAPRPIAAGFLPGAPIAADPAGEAAWALDATGRLVASARTTAGWLSVLLVPGRAEVPQLVRRQVEPAGPLGPVTVSFDNHHKEELIVRIADVRTPGRMIEHAIRPGGSVAQQVDRDPGGELVEIYLIPGPFGTLVQEEHHYPIPPRVLYTVAVYANRVTYSYRDRRPDKPEGSVPDFDEKSAVSLGVFPLPPGDLLAEGARIDVHREATSQQNPGEAAWYGVPR